MSTSRLEENWDAIIAEMEEGAKQAINQTIDDIVEEAQATAPVLSGALRDGIYGVHVGEDPNAAHATAEAAALKANPNIEVEPGLGSLEAEAGVFAGAVDVVATHGIYVHNGANGHPGRPFLENAGNGLADRFEARLDRIGGMLGSK